MRVCVVVGRTGVGKDERESKYGRVSGGEKASVTKILIPGRSKKKEKWITVRTHTPWGSGQA